MTESRIALLATVIVGVGIRAIVTAQGWFYWDDLILMARVQETGLPRLLLEPHDGHLMPGAWLVFSLLPKLNWPVALAVLVFGQLVTAFAVAYAALRICPNHAWWVTALYLLTPLTLPVTTWLSAAVNSLPLHAAAAVWLAHGWLYLHRRRGGDLVVVAAAVLAGCLFSERALLLAPVSLLLLWVWTRSRHIVRLTPAFLLPVVGWSVVYALVVGVPASPVGGPGFAAMLSHGYVRGFLPTLAGGPWSWERWHPGPPFADPHPAAVLAGAVVAAGLLGWALTKRAGGAMVIVLVYPVLPIAALALARSGPDSAPEIAQTLRHFAEVSVLLALTLGVMAGGGRRKVIPLVVVTLSALLSTATFSQSWAPQPARGYFTALQADLARRGAPILDQPVALEVLLPVAHPYNLASALLPPGQVQPWTGEPTLIDASGHLIPAELAPSRWTGWEPGCAQQGSVLDVPLDGPLVDRDWVVRLNVLSAGASVISVAIGEGDPVAVEVGSGLSEVFVQAGGGGERLRVATAGETVCLGRSAVGLLTASQ